MIRGDVDSLFKVGVAVTLKLLKANRRFYPFALAMEPAGKTDVLTGDCGTEMPGADVLIQILHQQLAERARQGRVRALAVISDVRVREPAGEELTDAIRVRIEHAEEEPVTCYLPYSLSGSTAQTGALHSEQGERLILGR